MVKLTFLSGWPKVPLPEPGELTMFRCPHCRSKAIPNSALFEYQAHSQCKACGTSVRMRIQPSTFLVPGAMLAVALAGTVTERHAPLAVQVVLMVTAFMLQVYLFEFRQVEPQPSALPRR